MGVRRFPLRRGIEPAGLLGLVKNTAPFLFSLKDAPVFIKRLQAYAGEELGHAEYFQLCLCAHWATCGTFVPTDVDNAMRLKLWEMDEATLEIKRAMADATIAAARWDYRPVTARLVRAPSGALLSTHEGTWFSVAVAAYAALRLLDPGKAAQVFAAMSAEAEREASLWREFLEAGNGLDILRVSALLAHNFGDLDRVINMWRLPADDALRRRLYDAAKPGSKIFDGRLGHAGLINQRFMAAENHRHFALREPRFLRTSADFLLPVSPFLDAWGRRVAQEPGEHVGEAVSALIYGFHRTSGSAAYPRALAGILEAFPGGLGRLKRLIPARDERLLSAGPLRTLISIPQERFEAQWSRFHRQIPPPAVPKA